jgi:hypothetical protein
MGKCDYKVSEISYFSVRMRAGITTQALLALVGLQMPIPRAVGISE